MNRQYPYILALVMVTVALAAQEREQGQGPDGAPGNAQRQQRDRAARPQPAGEARISGHVFTADTGRPVRRARIMIDAAELPGGRATLTDDQGLFEIPGLPAGRYSVNVSKSGFVTLSYGQRRPQQPGTPIQLAAGQQLASIDFKLPRGGVIAGHVVDDAGEPLAGANVAVMRYAYAQGARQLVPVGSANTDDQGAYRVWGLNPGSYYVTSTTRHLEGIVGAIMANAPPEATAMIEQSAAQFGGQAGGPFGGRGGGPGGRGGVAAMGFGPTAGPTPGGDAAHQVAYTPTYYPGVAQSSEAQAVTLGLSAEVSDINFGILLVRTGRVSGRAATADGAPVTFGNVGLVSESGRGPGMNLWGRIAGDGSFTIPMVPPGRYTLRARTGGQEAPQFAQQSITVGDGDALSLAIVLAPGATISGSVTFQTTTSVTVPDPSQIRLVAPTTDFAAPGPSAVARMERNGTFTMSGVMAGSHWLRPQSTVRGWTLKSVTVEGRDVTDTPFDVRSGQALADVSVVFTDRVSEVNGTLTDDHQTPVTGYTILAFPTDKTLWRPQARQIMTSRPDQNGTFQLRGLPPGDYYVVPADPEEQGEWFEPSFLEPLVTTAARISLGEGDVKTQNFTLATPSR